MTEEEEKAIDKIQNLVKYLKDWGDNFTIVPKDVKYFETILNMVQTYQGMINEQIEEVIDYEKEVEAQRDRINYLEELIDAMQTYYSITVEDLENCIKNDK